MPTRPARTAICSGDERKHHTREVGASDKVLLGPPLTRDVCVSDVIFVLLDQHPADVRVEEALDGGVGVTHSVHIPEGEGGKGEKRRGRGGGH